mmetsp:Transcript_59404/g.129121  ORF Transcript_59404/g.129121 Transcript_59404/m.129121 type:complete len:137 (+) Transcript_59404:347-757(+)
MATCSTVVPSSPNKKSPPTASATPLGVVRHPRRAGPVTSASARVDNCSCGTAMGMSMSWLFGVSNGERGHREGMLHQCFTKLVSGRSGVEEYGDSVEVVRPLTSKATDVGGRLVVGGDEVYRACFSVLSNLVYVVD